MRWEGSLSTPAARQSPAVRAEFLRRVYGRLLVGVAGFLAALWWLFSSGLAYMLADVMLAGSWLLVLGGFMVVSWLANRLTHAADASSAAQWGGFALLVAANAVIFTPLVVVAEAVAPGVVATAGWYTLVGVVVLSLVATRSGRSFAGFGLWLGWAGVLALGLIVTAVLFGFSLGPWFSLAMIGVAGAAILYDTQEVLERGTPGREVQCAALLFSSVTLMLWYMIRLLAATRR
jgi:FtsH-binding integral membrane protein